MKSLPPLARDALGVSLALVCTTVAVSAGELARPVPDTTYGIHVFDDQLPNALTDAQLEFWASRVAGTQKMQRLEADRLRAVNPGFLILHYRLGMGLGYRTITEPCVQGGGWFQIIDGDWVQEWPGDFNVQDPWFENAAGTRRVQCQHGWFLMDIDNPSWRSWWTDQVLTQLVNNDADGLFADSLMVPNFLGSWDPPLPGYDPVFEAEWTTKVEDMMRYLKRRLDGRWLLVPNAGWWVTSRDVTDFSIADGLFIEGFGRDVWAVFGHEGWRQQVDRLLWLVDRGGMVIATSYHNWGVTERGMSLASYLLVKGDRSFFNLEGGQPPDWWPEYEVPIGAPVESVAAVDDLIDPVSGMYRRRFTNGVVFVNPTTTARTARFHHALQHARPSGGGYLGQNGQPPPYALDFAPLTEITLQPGEGAVFVYDTTPHEIAVSPLVGGQTVEITVRNAAPGSTQVVFASRAGAGSTYLPAFGVSLDLTGARAVATLTADASGNATGMLQLPAAMTGADLSFQAAGRGSTTQVVTRRVY